MRNILSERLKVIFISMCFVILSTAVTLGLYWSLSKSDVLVINKSPIPVRTIRDHPTAEGVVILQANYCKRVKVKGETRISFIDHAEIFLPISEENSATGCRDIEVPVIIPKEISPDKYHIHFRIRYKVNPLKTVIEEFDTEEFEVVQ